MLKEDQQGLLALKMIKFHLDGFVNEGVKANAALDQLSLQWENLEDSMSRVLNDLKTNTETTGLRLKAMLDEGKQEWEQTLALAKQIQPNG